MGFAGTPISPKEIALSALKAVPVPDESIYLRWEDDESEAVREFIRSRPTPQTDLFVSFVRGGDSFGISPDGAFGYFPTPIFSRLVVRSLKARTKSQA